MANTTVTKAQITAVVKKVNGAAQAARTFKENVVTQQYRSKKMVTSLKGGEFLEFKTSNTFYNDKGEVTTIMAKYQNISGVGFFSISLRDMLNKLTTEDGASYAESVKFDENGDWNMPAVMYIPEVTKAKEGSEVYPLVSYNGYTPSIFQEEQDVIAKKIEAIKVPANLKSDAEAFLDVITVETTVAKMPL